MNKVETNVRGKVFILETGKIARQADGAVIAQCGDTVVLATVVSDKIPRKGLDFSPLTIDYVEKAYSAGKIPGGFFKREGRLSEKEILTSRLIDRPIRPLLPKGFFCETQGIVNVLSYGDENIADILGIISMSAAFTISDVPISGPVGAVRIGRIAGSFVINPDLREVEECDLDLIVAGTEDAVVMVEGESQEITEADLLEAIRMAHQEIKRLCAFQKELQAMVAKEKRLVIPLVVSEELKKTVTDISTEKIKSAITIPDKLRRQNVLDEILKETIEKLNTGEVDISTEIISVFNGIEEELVRGMIINDNIRVDGRRPEDIRKIHCEAGILPRTHGSALFVRGETQCLAVVTLGTAEDEQKINALEGDSTKTFMLHYNFPPFSVGEVKPLRSPGRREIGHGMLAERALKAVIPQKSDFPYTIRIVADILESNGSSSMATVCGGSLALMDAGVPIKTAVAGIAMGLVKGDKKSVVLTDISGIEDHLGDMDFKVSGTRTGITAFQMDVKVEGIGLDILKQALEQARVARLEVLNTMDKTISAPRPELSVYAPRITSIKIKPEKIGEVIGTGGKIIRAIIEQSGAKIDIEDDGMVYIAATNPESAEKAKQMIMKILEEPEMGKVYMGKVKKVTTFGAFVEILPGQEGLVHISELEFRRVHKVEDVVNVGDEIQVKVIGIEPDGKIRLSRKAT